MKFTQHGGKRCSSLLPHRTFPESQRFIDSMLWITLRAYAKISRLFNRTFRFHSRNFYSVSSDQQIWTKANNVCSRSLNLNFLFRNEKCSQLVDREKKSNLTRAHSENPFRATLRGSLISYKELSASRLSSESCCYDKLLPTTWSHARRES